MLSVIIPAYNEDATLPQAVKVLSGLLAEEGISDRTWEEICRAHSENDKVHGVHFSRNFGKEAAIIAGLSEASGDCAAVMDCDLQHPPATLLEMYRKWEEGYEVVEGVKRTRGKESGMHRFAAGTFYRIMSGAVKIDMTRASDFKLLDRRAVDSLLEMPERNAFFRAMSSWIGFKQAQVEFDVQDRTAGETKWSTRKLISYAISNIVGYSTAPMQVVTDRSRHRGLRAGSGAGDPDTGAVLHRACGGRFHNGHSADPADRKHHHDLAGHHRILHRKNL